MTNAKNDASILPPVSGTSLINVGSTERIISMATGFAFATWALRHLNKITALPILAVGGYMMLRGATGYCAVNTILRRNTATKKSDAVEASGTYIINKPRQDVYAFWRRLENLPLFMKHLYEVQQVDKNRSFWKVTIPGGFTTVSWNAEIVQDQPGEYLAWSSLPGSTIDNAGYVSFLDGPDNTTEIKARISYRLPGGDLGSVAAKLFNPFLQDIMLQDLDRFKQTIEGSNRYIKEKENAKKDVKASV